MAEEDLPPEEPVRRRGIDSVMRSYLVSRETLAMLDEIKAATGLPHSETVRRSVALLHGYLIHGKLPRKPKR